MNVLERTHFQRGRRTMSRQSAVVLNDYETNEQGTDENHLSSKNNKSSASITIISDKIDVSMEKSRCVSDDENEIFSDASAEPLSKQLLDVADTERNANDSDDFTDNCSLQDHRLSVAKEASKKIMQRKTKLTYTSGHNKFRNVIRDQSRINSGANTGNRPILSNTSQTSATNIVQLQENMQEIDFSTRLRKTFSNSWRNLTWKTTKVLRTASELWNFESP